jgi:hypothetical protein
MYNTTSNVLSFGIMGSMTYVPAGFSVETILQVGSGVNTVFESWGDKLLHRYGKNRNYKDRDVAVRVDVVWYHVELMCESVLG